jgi:hypothetical protein
VKLGYFFSRNVGTRAMVSWLTMIALTCLSTHAFAFNTFTVGGDNCNFTSLQDAINASTAGDGNTIFVAHNYTYSGQHLLIQDRKVNILGGYKSCAGDLDSSPTPISGTTGHSVFEIEGNSTVYMSLLTISGADLDGSHKGGGIYFGGSGSLEIVSSTITGNRAGYGGGIDMSPSGAATLTLLGSVISLNTASGQGGGIRLEGQSVLTVDNGTYITGNQATGADDIAYGGGIELVGPATANINGNLNNNTALYGGGVAALASDSGNVRVNLYSTNGDAATLYGNHGTSLGGGVYLKSSRNGPTASLCAKDFAIDANDAGNGAAIFADSDSGHGSAVYLNSPSCSVPDGAIACPAGSACNRIISNVSSQSGSATVLINSAGLMYANRFAARSNTSGRLISLIADTSIASVILDECLLVDNSLTSNLLWGNGGASDTVLFVHSCTMSHNTLGSSDPVIYANVGRLEITSSIIDQPAQTKSYDFTGIAANLFTQYVLTNNTSAFAQGAIDIIQGTPEFVDQPNGDYHEQRTSPSVDVAPSSADSTDLDGNPRSVDQFDVPNIAGPVDLGAYEIQTAAPPGSCLVSDTIFCNGFELTN